MVILQKKLRTSILLVGVGVVTCSVQALLSQQAPPAEATPQRPTFSNDVSTTVPGTLELEFGVTGPARALTLPTTFKFTPPVERGFFHEMEFSLGFDSLERVAVDGQGKIEFSESLDLAVRRPLWRGHGFSFAVAPRAEFLLRDNSALVGGKAIGVYGFDLNNLVVNISALGATSPSDDDPGWLAEIVGGYNRTLGHSGVASRFSLAVEMMNGFAKSQDAILSLLQGISYRPRPNLVIDLAVEQRGLRSGDFEIILQGGVTCNLGRIWQ